MHLVGLLYYQLLILVKELMRLVVLVVVIVLVLDVDIVTLVIGILRIIVLWPRTIWIVNITIERFKEGLRSSSHVLFFELIIVSLLSVGGQRVLVLHEGSCCNWRVIIMLSSVEMRPIAYYFLLYFLKMLQIILIHVS